MTRRLLPTRRRSWTQRVRIGGQAFYLTCGEYEDGTLGEIWIETKRENTFVRGILGSLARTTSIALQTGTDVREVIKSLRNLTFPPSGIVEGEGTLVKECSSVADWVAQELEIAYAKQQ